MEQLDLLWEYQQLDLKMVGYEHEIKRSPLRDKLVKLKKYMIEHQNVLIKYNDEANKKTHILNRIFHDCEVLENKFKEDKRKVEENQVKSIKQLELIEKDMINLKSLLGKKQADLNKLIKDIGQFSNKIKTIRAKMVKAKKEYDSIKVDYNKEVEHVQKDFNEVKAKAEKMRKKIDKSLLSKYDNLRVTHNTAIASIESGRCGGCNMSLPSVVIKKVAAGAKMVECENCGRILYAGFKNSDN